MGRNSKLFQKRKAASEESLRRGVARRPTNKRVLIVCEGAKTERLYFERVVCSLNLISVDVEICGEGLAPNSLVADAERRVRAEGKSDDAGYNAVFCVFDRDTHDSFEAAKSRIQTLVKQGVFPNTCDVCIYSIPSFEYWFLIHFEYTRAPFSSVGGVSAGARVVRSLRAVPGFENYEKSLSNSLLNELMDSAEVACTNAEKALSDADNTREENPSTKVHLLYYFLRDLGKN